MLFALPGLASGSPGEGDRYRLVSTLRVSTLEKELNQGVAAGYRVAGLWYSGQLFAVLEKAPATEGPRQYRVLEAGSPKNLGARINEAAARGFRVVQGIVLSKPGAVGQDTIVLMERAPGPPAPRCEYRVVATMRQSTFDQETAQAQHEGWTPVGTVAVGGDVAILERQPGARRSSRRAGAAFWIRPGRRRAPDIQAADRWRWDTSLGDTTRPLGQRRAAVSRQRKRGHAHVSTVHSLHDSRRGRCPRPRAARAVSDNRH